MEAPPQNYWTKLRTALHTLIHLVIIKVKVAKDYKKKTNDGISQHIQAGNNNKRYDKSIALQMWPSGYYIRPKGGSQITPSMKMNEVRKHDKWESTNKPGSFFWSDIHINNEWIVFTTPSNNIIEEEIEVGQHGWQ